MKKELTGYPSIDLPQSRDAKYFEKNPIIPNVSVYELLRMLSIKFYHSPAIDCLDLKADYSELINTSITISLALKELGVSKGDIISVAMPDYFQAVALFFACNRIGATVSYLDPHCSKEELCNYINDFESHIFVNFDKTDEYNDFVLKNSNAKYIITLNKNDINSLEFYKDYRISRKEELIDYSSLGSIAKFKKNHFEPLHFGHENALILFTSGTTGKPKSVVLTNGNIVASEIYSMNTSNSNLINGNKTLTCVPFSYPYGFVTSTLTSLLWGKENILAPNISGGNVSYFYSKRPNIIFGSPAFLDLSMKNIPDDQDLSFVHHFVSGGDFLTPSHAERGCDFYRNHGASDISIGNGCGNAETVSVCSNAIGIEIKPTTAGKLLTGISAIIVDPESFEELKYGEEGLLLVSGKHVFKGYFKNEELTRESLVTINGKEYFKTGTIGFIDEAGYLTVTGRQSRFYINSSLNKIYCDKIQNAICCLDFVDDCAVVKVPDDNQLFVNKAYVVLNQNCKLFEDVEETIRYLLLGGVDNSSGEHIILKDYEIPTYIEFVDELPRKHGTEKIDYSSLEENSQKQYILSKKNNA